MFQKIYNLLLIEDDIDAAELIQEMFKKMSEIFWNIDHCENIACALHNLQKKKFDIILTDLHLPDSHGLATVTRLLEKNRDVPIVVLTTNQDKKTAMEAIKKGAQDYLVKGMIEMEHITRSILYSINRNRVLGTWKEDSQKQYYLATHDYLTDLPNRYLFEDLFNRSLARVIRHHQHLAIIFLDLDGFKNINDQFGHRFGDLLLQEVAKRLQFILRKEDSICRFGGDEFTILLPLIETKANVKHVIEKIKSTLAKPISIAQQSVHITASCGFGFYPTDGETFSTLLEAADLSMYQYKKRS